MMCYGYGVWEGQRLLHGKYRHCEHSKAMTVLITYNTRYACSQILATPDFTAASATALDICSFKRLSTGLGNK